MSQYLIVGGTQGIGRALVDMLVSQGHEVHVWARNAVVIPGALVYSCDITDQAASLPEIPAPLNGVVYCPGSINLKPFSRLSPEDFLQDLHINLLGAVRALQAAHKSLKQSPQSSVVLFSSVAANCGMPYHASIAAAKGAVEGLTLSLAAEWAPAIRVNAIAPSLTLTPLADKLISSAEKRELASKRHPLQKLGEAEDLAAMAAFLLSPAARWMTGQVVHVDGGLSSIKL